MKFLLRKSRCVVGLFCAVVLVAFTNGSMQIFHSFRFDARADTNKWAEAKDLVWLMKHSFSQLHSQVVSDDQTRKVER